MDYSEKNLTSDLQGIRTIINLGIEGRDQFFMNVMNDLRLFDFAGAGIQQPGLGIVRIRDLEHGRCFERIDLQAVRVARCERIAHDLIVQRRRGSRNGIQLGVALRQLRQ